MSARDEENENKTTSSEPVLICFLQISNYVHNDKKYMIIIIIMKKDLVLAKKSHVVFFKTVIKNNFNLLQKIFYDGF